MSKVEFINNRYTEDGLKLPIIHFPGEEKMMSCPKFDLKVIDSSGHTYKGKEQETGELILKWVNDLLR